MMEPTSVSALVQDPREPGGGYGPAGAHHDRRDRGQGSAGGALRAHPLQETG